MKAGEIFNPYGLLKGAYIPNAIMKNPELSYPAKILYARLLQYAGNNGVCYPAIETLAEEIAASKQYVIKLLKELESKSFIKRQKPTGKEKLLHKTNRYFFLWHPVFEQSKMVIAEGEQEFTPEGQQMFTSESNLQLTSNNNECNKSIRNKPLCNNMSCGQSEKEQMTKFRDHVFLTDNEYKNLLNQLGKEKTEDYIIRLNDYIHQIGVQKAKAKYKSHYHVILNWHRREQAEIERRLKVAETIQKKKEEVYFS